MIRWERYAARMRAVENACKDFVTSRAIRTGRISTRPKYQNFYNGKFSNYVRELTGDASIALEHSLNVCLTALECVEVADKDPGVYRLGILRIGLVPHLTHLHSAFGRHCPVCLQRSVQ
jgi:hypothetical protein